MVAVIKVASSVDYPILTGLTGIVVDDAGNIYSTNSLDNIILKTSSTSPAVVSQFSIDSSNLLQSPLGLAFNSSGTLFCTCNDNNLVVQLDSSGVVSQFSIDSSNLLDSPVALAFNSSGTLFCSCNSNNNKLVVQLDSSGVVTPFADNSNGKLPTPFALAFNSSGTLFCSNGGDSSVVQIDSSGVVNDYILTNNLISSPYGLAFDSYDTLYIAAYGTGLVYRTQNSSQNLDETPFIGNTTTGIINSANAVNIAISSNILYMNSYYSESPNAYIYKTTTTLCFNYDTKILCLNHLLEEEYIPIQDLNKGDLVKTYLHDYRKIHLIHKGVLFNNPNEWNQCMYKMEKTDENGLLEDLIVTGGHSILVDSISDREKEKLCEIGLQDYADKIENKYLVLAAVSDEFIQVKNNNKYTYYHFTLESEDDNQRFGIWANGILAEIISNNYLLNNR